MVLVPKTALCHQRIVSLNLCADQLLLMLEEKESIAALTHLAADASVSVMADKALKIPFTHGRAEEVIALNPDLIITGKYTTAATSSLLKKLGYNVIEIDMPQDFDSIRTQVRKVAKILGNSKKGEKILADMDKRLANIHTEKPLTAVVYQANGFTAGKGTLIDSVITAAGLKNIASINGYGFLSIEKLLLKNPDILIFDTDENKTPALAGQMLKHPALTHFAKTKKTVTLPAKYWSCGVPAVIDIVEKLHEATR